MNVDMSNYYATTSGVIQILGISLVGFIFAKMKYISQESCRSLTNVVVRFFLPALIISNITRSFDPTLNRLWWLLPMTAVIMYAVSSIVGILFFIKTKDVLLKREAVLACGFHNCAFLPLSLLSFICASEQCSELFVYIFLFNIFFDISIWATAFVVLRKKIDYSLTKRPFFNPPSISTFLALLFVFCCGTDAMPDVIDIPLRMVGNATLPIALVMLGATLYYNRGYSLSSVNSISRVLLAKLIVMPLIAGVALKYLFDFSPDIEFIIFLQAMMPTAVTLVLIGEYLKVDNKFFSGVIFYSHVFSVITIPIWLIMYNRYVAQ
jgi:malate permease and related proteins